MSGKRKIYKLHRSARGKVGKRRALSRRVSKYKNRLPWRIRYVFTETHSRPIANFFAEWMKLLKSDEEVVFGPPPQIAGPAYPLAVNLQRFVEGKSDMPSGVYPVHSFDGPQVITNRGMTPIHLNCTFGAPRTYQR